MTSGESLRVVVEQVRARAEVSSRLGLGALLYGGVALLALLAWRAGGDPTPAWGVWWSGSGLLGLLAAMPLLTVGAVLRGQAELAGAGLPRPSRAGAGADVGADHYR